MPDRQPLELGQPVAVGLAATFSEATRHILDARAGTGPELVRNTVDSRIEDLENEIRALKSHRNTVALTGVLPAEILSNIFLANANAHHDDSSHAWIRVACVCQHWREVALGCPTLWSCFTRQSKPEFMELMLKRSQKALLSVNMNLSAGTLSDQQRTLFSENERLRVLELAIRGHSETSPALAMILPSSSGPALALKSIVLKGNPSNYGHCVTKIPENFLQGGGRQFSTASALTSAPSRGVQ